MNDLALIVPELLPGALTTAEIDSTMRFAEAEKAVATRAAYLSDWRDFAAWCLSRGAAALPAHQGIVAAYLSWLADSGRKASTIGRRAAAIADRHKRAGYESPTNGEGVKATLRGIRRTIGTLKQGKAPATADLIGAMLKLAPNTMIGARDRALICLGFAAALRRSELCALNVDDLTEVPDGIRLRIKRSKTDQTGEGVELPIPRGSKLRPVECVNAWLAISGIISGPLFRAVRLGGTIGDEPLRPNDSARIIKKYARRIGLDAAVYSGHSLRSGFLTSAAESGASLLRMADQSRHKSLEVLRGYVRRTDMWKDHPGGAFL
jgi:integrase